MKERWHPAVAGQRNSPPVLPQRLLLGSLLETCCWPPHHPHSRGPEDSLRPVSSQTAVSYNYLGIPIFYFPLRLVKRGGEVAWVPDACERVSGPSDSRSCTVCPFLVRRLRSPLFRPRTSLVHRCFCFPSAESPFHFPFLLPHKAWESPVNRKKKNTD